MSLISKLSKLKNIVLAEDEYLDDDFVGMDYPSEEDLDEINKGSQNLNKPNALANLNPFNNNNQSSKVVGMPGISNGVSEVALMEPRDYEEMTKAIQAIRERKTIIVNLSMLEPRQAQRFIDCVAGGTYAIDGTQEQIGKSHFIFAPSCVNVTDISSEGATPRNVSTEGNSQYISGNNTTPKPAWGDFKLSAYS